jgi:hypothetical protein
MMEFNEVAKGLEKSKSAHTTIGALGVGFGIFAIILGLVFLISGWGWDNEAMIIGGAVIALGIYLVVRGCLLHNKASIYAYYLYELENR